nr:hypothetical protein [Tanacetum cinerariifolium]
MFKNYLDSVRGELKEEVKVDVKEEMKVDLKEEIKAGLKEEMNNELKEEMYEELKEEMCEDLKEEMRAEIQNMLAGYGIKSCVTRQTKIKKGRKTYLLKDNKMPSIGYLDNFEGNTRDLDSYGEETNKITTLYESG